MSRSGYADGGDIEDYLAYGRHRGRVASAIRGQRGQAFLQKLAAEMDAMPRKILIANELINEDGDCCAIGVVCKARGVDVSKLDYESPEQVGAAVGIAKQMAAEIEYENDQGSWYSETPADRWQRMRRWVEASLRR